MSVHRKRGNKGVRRAHLKEFSAGNTHAPKVVNRVVLNEYKARALRLDQQAPLEVSNYLECWQTKDPITGFMVDVPDYQVPERIKVLRRLRDITAIDTGWLRVLTFRHIKVKEDGHKRICMYSGGNEYFFIHADKLHHRVKMSRTYYARSHAERAFFNDLIIYEQELTTERFRILAG